MSVRKLDHVNVRTPRLAETIRFYDAVLGMKAGPPPMAEDMSLAAWIRDDGGLAVLHIVSADVAVPSRDADFVAPESGTGTIDHVALECGDYDAMLERVEAAGARFRRNEVPEMNLRQLFVEDPNGIVVELNFR
jgi:catechol 2,3-dioxygenase-like lactoylglutathione lyase family enzyme